MIPLILPNWESGPQNQPRENVAVLNWRGASRSISGKDCSTDSLGGSGEVSGDVGALLLMIKVVKTRIANNMNETMKKRGFIFVFPINFSFSLWKEYFDHTFENRRPT
jgi:hypothetical protein